MRRIGQCYMKHPRNIGSGIYVFGGKYSKKELLAGGVDDIRGVPRFVDFDGKALRKAKTLLEMSEQPGTFYFLAKRHELYVHGHMNQTPSDHSVIA